MVSTICIFRQFIFKKISDWNADHFFGGERAQKSPRGEGWKGYDPLSFF